MEFKHSLYCSNEPCSFCGSYNKLRVFPINFVKMDILFDEVTKIDVLQIVSDPKPPHL